jgi:hypothetical protein
LVMLRRVKGQKHEQPSGISVYPISHSGQIAQDVIVEAAGNFGDKITRRSAMKLPQNKRRSIIRR